MINILRNNFSKLSMPLLLIFVFTTSIVSAQTYRKYTTDGSKRFKSLRLSADEKSLISSNSYEIAIWDVDSGKQTLWKNEEAVLPHSVGYSSKYIVLQEYDDYTRKSRFDFRSSDNTPHSEIQLQKSDTTIHSQLSPNGKLMAVPIQTNKQLSILIYDLESRKLISTCELRTDEKDVSSYPFEKIKLEFDQAGKQLLYANYIGTNSLKIFDVKSSKLLSASKNLLTNVVDATFSEDGRQVAVVSRNNYRDSSIIIMNTKNLNPLLGKRFTPKELGFYLTAGQSGQGPLICFFQQDKSMLICGEDNVVIVDLDDLKVIGKLYGVTDPSYPVVSRNGQSIFCLNTIQNHSVIRWDWKKALGENQSTSVLKSHPPGELRPYVCYSPDGKHIALTCASRPYNTLSSTNIKRSVEKSLSSGRANLKADELTILLLDAQTKKPVKQFSSKVHPDLNYGRRYVDMNFSNDGKSLASTNEKGKVVLWDINSEKFKILKSKSRHSSSTDWSLDDKLLLVMQYNNFEFHNLENGEVQYIGIDSNYSHTARYSPNGKFIVSGKTLYDAKSGKKIFEGKDVDGIKSVFSRDSMKYFVWSTKSNGLSVVDLETGETTFPFFFHGKDYTRIFIMDVAANPKVDQIATASLDGNIRLWDLNSSQLITTFTGHQGKVTSIDFAPDGKSLVSIGVDGTTRFWDCAVPTD